MEMSSNERLISGLLGYHLDATAGRTCQVKKKKKKKGGGGKKKKGVKARVLSVQEAAQRLVSVVLGLLGNAGIRYPVEA